MALSLLRVALAALIAAALLGSLATCAQPDPPPEPISQGDPSPQGAAAGALPPEPDPGRELRETARSVLRPVIWISGVSAVLSILLSNWLPFGKAATTGAVAAFAGGLALQYAVSKYGVLFAEVAVWSGVLLALAAAAPWVVAFVRKAAARAKLSKGAELAMKGHVDAGVAFLADARDDLFAQRKAIFAAMTDAAAAAEGTREEQIRRVLAAFGVPERLQPKAVK